MANGELTKEQVAAGLAIIVAVGNAIRDLGTVPAGHLYAQLMPKLSLREFELIIAQLKNAKLVSEKGYELRWIGPAKCQEKPAPSSKG